MQSAPAPGFCSAHAPAGPFAAFARQRTALLTTYRRDGTPVGTPVHIAAAGDRAYFRTYHTAGKAKRLRNNAAVALAPSTVRGTPTGPAIHARARLLAGGDARTAARALARTYPLLHGVLVPLVHRLRGWRTLHYALTVGA